MTPMRTSANTANSNYILGWSDTEEDRLIRQAMLLAPMTERLFREAGIGEGQRVLDIGSGVGDVAMIAARLVGRSGEVVGIERNADYMARARERVAAAGFRNVTFIQSDLNDITLSGPFDSAVGRLILTFFPDPVAVMRSVVRLLSPRGVVAIIEPSWSPAIAFNARVPTFSRLITTTHELFQRLGIDTERGPNLYRIFQDAGLPAPLMHLDMEMGHDAFIADLQTELLRAVQPDAERHGVSLAELGDLHTLADRIEAELLASRSPIAYVAMVSAWSRRSE
jgi:ubiquinone/menaquinone biosynthesis C-methylase UbiE